MFMGVIEMIKSIPIIVKDVFLKITVYIFEILFDIPWPIHAAFIIVLTSLAGFIIWYIIKKRKEWGYYFD